MAGNLPNLYTPNLSGVDPQSARIIRDLVERMNYLTTELSRVRGVAESASPGVDAAKKENPKAGIITIPAIGGDGQPGLVRVNKDGVIVSYVNPTESLFPYVDITQVGNVTTGLDPLHAYTLKAGTLSQDGDCLRVHYGGGYANTENDKQLRVRFDSQLVISFGAVIDLENGNWYVDLTYVRTSPTTVRIMGDDVHVQFRMADGVVVTSPSGSFHGVRGGLITVANLNTTDVVLDVFGEGTSTDDVFQRVSLIDFIRPRVVKLV